MLETSQSYLPVYGLWHSLMYFKQNMNTQNGKYLTQIQKKHISSITYKLKCNWTKAPLLASYLFRLFCLTHFLQPPLSLSLSLSLSLPSKVATQTRTLTLSGPLANYHFPEKIWNVKKMWFTSSLKLKRIHVLYQFFTCYSIFTMKHEIGSEQNWIKRRDQKSNFFIISHAKNKNNLLLCFSSHV